eukprot:TRINITY_DN29552_c0_g1_i1.p1 TRINITY_DN29552_c0_g1~~TRINITY_DN29552_c0_g1_i1.p1  ORF type:complete len:160 (-),score=0.79 TRINITY_DN29552_c0_g1_i1:166-645(-)
MFNHVVGMDLFFFKFREIEIPMLNMICWGTGLRMVEVLPNKNSLTVRKAFMKSWVKHYSWPAIIVVDQGREFFGDFGEYIGDQGVLVLFIISTETLPGRMGAQKGPADCLKTSLVLWWMSSPSILRMSWRWPFQPFAIPATVPSTGPDSPLIRECSDHL